ncbi:MAG: dihydroorotate dehydrogenase [Clostridiales Family XIII bacterium]|jgi:dihydroorotate dehydrogenase (NAD+) catalytic subunit|nr:dihydroorotate dehydrogenase [Clostridiales Family XIII bacterium]
MKNFDLSVNIAGVTWKNPVTTASGTFSGQYTTGFYDPSLLGAVTTKGVAPLPWEGNPTPRIAETYGGMLNSVGLENKGVDDYITGELRALKDLGATVICNVCGHSVDEYLEVVSKLDGTDVDMLELNISCPNISCGGIGFGTDANLAAELVREVRKLTRKPLIVKLTPNVTDISAIARSVEEAGADAISLINTLLGMRIDLRTGQPVLANGTGGLSGPAVKPVAVRMVYQVSRAVSLPVIGMGGIMTGADALEFLLAGARAVAVGTAALINPVAPIDILSELTELLHDEQTLELLRRNYEH